ncbi:MAG: hypothetical protein AVDCRST_MAG34-1649 [uncultured Nocardioidaceae bacterium]|uniref:Uncharacterized protein n=1 Tax=uncultured Nocardioidaceae bacterium TaxID=253824 RepID=A0A6J4M5T7_9ACTN|nr:MAG: hypothetical protein AVDCRST_MAG34-1649 [uncultured Nocardioidaceae bacterium]
MTERPSDTDRVSTCVVAGSPEAPATRVRFREPRPAPR